MAKIVYFRRKNKYFCQKILRIRKIAITLQMQTATTEAPVWGKERRDVDFINYKAFIRADS
ncbi:MAG: hypothetical protein NC095_03775 [Muribaculum sp.]|nr:hypothetical protein [Muribaculum sp.]